MTGDIEQKIQQRTDFALRLNLSEKAKTITEILGKPYNFSHSSTITLEGYQYKKNNLKIFSYNKLSEENKACTQIYLRNNDLKHIQQFLLSFLRFAECILYEEVYSQENDSVLKFKDEGKWLNEIGGLYHKASIKKDSATKSKP